MIVQLDVSSQLKRSAENLKPTYELRERTTLHQFLLQLANENREMFKKFILDNNASIRKSLLLSVNDKQVSHGQDVELKDRDRVLILLPISGG